MKLLTPFGFEIDAADADVEMLLSSGFTKPKAKKQAVKKADSEEAAGEAVKEAKDKKKAKKKEE